MCATHVSSSVLIRSRKSSSSWYRSRNFNADSMRFAYCSGAHFSEQQVFRDNFVQQGAGNLREITAEFRNCDATILHNAFPHKLHKVLCNYGWSPTALLTLHLLSTCCKLCAPGRRHLFAHDVRLIDQAHLIMYFDLRYALCIQKLYYRSYFTVGGSWNKSLQLQPLQ